MLSNPKRTAIISRMQQRLLKSPTVNADLATSIDRNRLKHILAAGLAESPACEQRNLHLPNTGMQIFPRLNAYRTGACLIKLMSCVAQARTCAQAQGV